MVYDPCHHRPLAFSRLSQFNLFARSDVVQEASLNMGTKVVPETSCVVFQYTGLKQFSIKMCKVVCLANYIYRTFLNWSHKTKV